MAKYQVKTENARGDDLARRFLSFAVRVIKLVNALPKNAIGGHIGIQLLRAGTSTGANYEEARGAESRADFVHKVSIVHKEIKECRFWLRLIHEAAIVKPGRVQPLLQECEELCAITGKSVMTAKKRQKKK